MRGKSFFKKAGLTCLFLFLIFSYRVKAIPQNYFTSEQSKAYQYLLKLEFKECISLLKGQNAYNFQIKSLATCVDAFVNCDKRKYQAGRRMSIKWLDSLNTLPESPEKNYARAQVKLHWAFLSSSYGEKVIAALDIRQAYLLLKENYQKYPTHKPTLLYYGLLNAFISDIPENYRWLANAVGLKSMGRKGLDMVDLSKNCHPLLDLERNALMLLRRPQSERQEIGLTNACNSLMESNGNDDFIRFIVAFYYLKNKNTHEALIITKSMSHSAEPMLVYQKALASYNSLETDTAIYYFKKFIKINKSESFKKDVNLRLSYLYFLEGDTVQALRYRSAIKRMGNDAIYADKIAGKLAEQPIPDFQLLKSRILFDAGSWNDAKRFLLLLKPTNIGDKSEYFYRLGKVEDELGNKEESKKYFRNCVTMCPVKGLYYGPFACLNMSEIYLNESNKLLATYYLNKSQSFSDYDYQQTYKSRYTELAKLIK